ncbi:MAG: M48 family metallopeptidase [Bacteriovoracaceae bacterium]
MQLSTVTQVFLSALCLKVLITNYLDNRNKRHILRNQNQVPDKFEDKITLEEHQKAARYSVAKINAGKIFRFIELVILLFWTVGYEGIERLHLFILGFNLSPITEGLVYFSAFIGISTVLSLPQSIYTTFVLEEKFGFNKTTPKTFVIDMIKGLILGAIIGLPILGLILWIMAETQLWWLYAWAVVTAFQLIIIWAYPTVIAPLFNKFTELEEGEVKDVVVKLLDRTGFESKGLFVMDASKRTGHGNAYFTGFGKNKRIVFFDTLLNNLSPAEIEAVLAHELGHFKRKHILKMLFRGVLMSLLGFYILFKLSTWPEFYTGHGVQSMAPHLTLMLFMQVSGIYTFFLTPLFSWFSRKHEFEADEFAAQYSSASELISALVKLYKENASTLTPDPMYSNFYHSHPPALIRVRHLESLER